TPALTQIAHRRAPLRAHEAIGADLWAAVALTNGRARPCPKVAFSPEIPLLSRSAFAIKDATMKMLWLVALTGLSTSAMGQPYHKAPAPPPACHPVTSWTDWNANVCIKYACEYGGFQIRCLPAPVLR